MYIKWNATFSVGIEKIDAQHKKLVDLINRLYAAFIDKRENEEMSLILNELVEYTIYHFTFERTFFPGLKTAEIQEHTLQHDNFVKKIKEFQVRFQKNEVPITASLINFLRDWLTNHIMKTDKGFLVDNSL
jgi:hemerythrin